MRTRSKKQIYEPTEPIQRARFITAVDKNGQYPDEESGANVMPCRFARSLKFPKESGSQILSQTAGSVFAWVYTGSWMPFGTYLSAVKVWGRWWTEGDPETPDPMSIRKWDTNNRFLWGHAIENGGAGFRRVRISPVNGKIYALHYYSSSAANATSALHILSSDGELLDSAHLPILGRVADAQMDLDIKPSDGGLFVVGWTRYRESGVHSDYLWRSQLFDKDLNALANQAGVTQLNSCVCTENHNIAATEAINEHPPPEGGPVEFYQYPHYYDELGAFWLDDFRRIDVGEPGGTTQRRGFIYINNNDYLKEYRMRGICVDDDGYVYMNGDYVENALPVYKSGSVFKSTPITPLSSNASFITDVIDIPQAPISSKAPIHYSDGHIWFFSGDQKLQKYTTDLAHVWSSTDSQFGLIEDIKSDADGNIYLTGIDRQANFPSEPDNTWCIAPDGTPIWSHNIRGDQHSIAVDQDTGEYYTSGMNAINPADFQ